MTHLHVVRDNQPTDLHSRRVDPLTHARTLEAITWKIVGPAETAAAELRAAILSGDTANAIPGLRRLVAVGELAKSLADQVERGAA